MRKKITKFLLLFALVTPFAVNTATVNAATTFETDNPKLEPLRPIIEYRYKLVKGYLYRRLYDATNDKWLGPWEKI
ncbi:MAG: hypothetical protein ACRCZW_08220 [Lactobacillaceae bacterium]